MRSRGWFAPGSGRRSTPRAPRSRRWRRVTPGARARLEEEASFAALAVALGLDPGQPVRPAGFEDENLPTPLEPLAAAAFASEARPELRRLEAELASRQAAYGAAVGARWPTLGVLSSGNLSRAQILTGTGIEGPGGSAGASLYLRWAALDPAVWRRAELARAARDEARRQLEATALALRAEVVEAAYAVQRAEVALTQSAEILATAELARAGQAERYRAGAASLLELLDAEGLEQSARRQRIEAQRDHRIARVRLLALSGALEQLARAAQLSR